MWPMRLALAVTVLVVSVWAWQVFKARRRAPKLTERERHEREQIRAWRGEVLRRLGPAVRRLELARTPGKTGVGAIEGIDLVYPGQPIEAGWQWRFTTPGIATVADLKVKEARLQSALNTPTQLVQALAVTPDARYQGHGTLRVYRRDPLHKVRHVDWPAGTSPMASPVDPVLAGITRWGKEIRLPLYQTHWGIVGQNNSGKSAAVFTLLDNLAAHVLDGTVRLTFVDVAKGGRGYKAYRPLFANWYTEDTEALNGVEDLLRRVRLRAGSAGDRAVIPTRDDPLEVLIVEEGPEFLIAGARKRSGATLLTQFAQQTRELAAVLVFVSQTMHHTVVPTRLRAQLRLKTVFRVATLDETRMSFDGASETSDGPHTIPKSNGENGSVDWRGVSYVDPDGTGVELVRWLYADERRARQVGGLGAKVS